MIPLDPMMEVVMALDIVAARMVTKISSAMNAQLITKGQITIAAAPFHFLIYPPTIAKVSKQPLP